MLPDGAEPHWSGYSLTDARDELLRRSIQDRETGSPKIGEYLVLRALLVGGIQGVEYIRDTVCAVGADRERSLERWLSYFGR